MSTMRKDTETVKDNWTVYVEKTESQYLEDTSAVEIGKKDLEEVLHSWYVDTFFLVGNLLTGLCPNQSLISLLITFLFL